MTNLKKNVYVGFVVAFVALGLGCASTQKTTKTETTTTYPSEASGNKGYLKTTAANSDDHVVEKTETTTTTEAKAENPGVLSSTLHAIGYVLVLPFIVIGGIFKIIFGG